MKLPDLHPYLGPVNFSETFENEHKKFRLDGLGCRWNPLLRYDDDEIPEGPIRVLVGGSVVFGVGASDDGQTIASQMTVADEIPTYPIGERGLGSWQELHGFLTRMHHLKPSSLVILSGYNDGFWASRFLNVPNHLTSNSRLVGLVNTPFLAQSHLGLASMGAPRIRRMAALLVAGITNLDLLREAMLIRLPVWHWPRAFAKLRQVVLDQDEVISALINSQMVTTTVWSALARSLNCELKFFLQPSQTWISSIEGSSNNTFKGSDVQRDFFIRIRLELAHALQQSALTNGFAFDDLNKRFVGLGNWRDLFVDDAHLNDEGQSFLANLITSI